MKWEYKLLSIGENIFTVHNIEKVLNEYGQDRWEVINIKLEQSQEPYYDNDQRYMILCTIATICMKRVIKE